MRRWSIGMFLTLAGIGLSCAPSVSPPTKGSGPAPVAPVSAVAPKGLETRIQTALDLVRNRKLLTTHGFWTVFHGILGLGPDTCTLQYPDSEPPYKKVNALDYICKGNPVRGLRFIVTPQGLDVQNSAPGSGVEIYVGQGHQDQFIAEMVQWGLPPERKFLVAGHEYTFMDFLRFAKMRASVTQKQELSWAIVVIGEHFGTDLEWVNGANEKLRYEDIVRYELEQPTWDTAACGGTHRLFGLTWALYRHQEHGGKLEGVWKDVLTKLEDSKLNAKKHRRSDGAFSTGYFKEPPSNDENIQLRISTSGHVLEWLSLYLPDRELHEGWMQEAASAVALMILDSRDMDIEGGALYHAAHGLHLYHDRVFGDPKARRPYPLPAR